MLSLFFVLIKGWCRNATFTPASFLCGGVLGILLIFQSVLICGSLSILDMVNSCEEYMIQMVVPYVNSLGNSVVTAEDRNELTGEIISQFPLLEYFIVEDTFSNLTISELPSAIAEECRSYFHWYIFRRVMWSLGFVVVAAIVVIKTMDKSYTHHRYSSYNSEYSDYSDCGGFGNDDFYQDTY